MKPTNPPNRNGDAIIGFFLGIGLHLLQLFYLPSGILIGITQLIYIIPALILFRRRKGIMQGLLFAAAITFLLNAACFGIIMYQL